MLCTNLGEDEKVKQYMLTPAQILKFSDWPITFFLLSLKP